MFVKTENIAFVFREKERVMKRDRNKPAMRALLPLTQNPKMRQRES